MEYMKEDKMKFLTQEEFDKIIKDSSDYRHTAYITDYIVKDISINDSNIIPSSIFNIDFENCRIESIKEFNVSLPPIAISVSFHECVIVDYENVDSIDDIIISDCTVIKPIPFACPESGEFIGYKKCRYGDFEIKYIGTYAGVCIVKLLIPADSKRSSSFGRKCRCSKAKVLGFYDMFGNEINDNNGVTSIYDPKLIYEIGKWVYPDSFDDNRYVECSHGIHFFMSFDEAKYY